MERETIKINEKYPAIGFGSYAYRVWLWIKIEKRINMKEMNDLIEKSFRIDHPKGE